MDCCFGFVIFIGNCMFQFMFLSVLVCDLLMSVLYLTLTGGTICACSYNVITKMSNAGPIQTRNLGALLWNPAALWLTPLALPKLHLPPRVWSQLMLRMRTLSPPSSPFLSLMQRIQGQVEARPISVTFQAASHLAEPSVHCSTTSDISSKVFIENKRINTQTTPNNISSIYTLFSVYNLIQRF